LTNRLNQADSRIYSCPVEGCTRSFGRKFTLNRHILTKAESDVEHNAFAIPLRATKCEICNKTFEDAPRLRRHLGARACLPAEDTGSNNSDILSERSVSSSPLAPEPDTGQLGGQIDTSLQLWMTRPSQEISFDDSDTLSEGTLSPSPPTQNTGQPLAPSDAPLKLWRTCQPKFQGTNPEEERLINFCEPPCLLNCRGLGLTRQTSTE
jgi:hypothetical protein